MKKRMVVLTVTFVFVLSGILGRIGYIIFSKNYTVSSSYNSYSLTIADKGATIYDMDLSKLTNSTTSYVAVIRPNEKCLTELHKLFSSEEIKEIQKELSLGYPIIKDIDKKVDTKYIQIYLKANKYSNNQLCEHLISKYSSGVESHFQDALNVTSQLKINYSVDAKGRLLFGDEGELLLDNYNSKEGISLTIKKSVQDALEYSLDSNIGFKKGCGVVIDVESGKIVASASRPNLDLNDLNKTDNDYLNRVLSAYCVGSVFKLVVSASALENGINPSYSCSGKITIGDTTYSCLNEKKHGKQSMKEALANSCNCYFAELAQKIGPERLYETAKKLGFGDSTKLADDWLVSNGHLPSKSALENSKGELALLGFGQGSLTSTPLQFASVVQAIANDGMYICPTILNGTVNKSGKIIKSKIGKKTRVMSVSTAKKLQSYMRYIVTNGSASFAESSDKKSACKTSTAQSGQFVGKNEILRTWVAGFYPYDNPKYAIVIVNENGISGSSSCCPIFKTLVDKLCE